MQRKSVSDFSNALWRPTLSQQYKVVILPIHYIA